jgi:murein tripeptide amidase MpaA
VLPKGSKKWKRIPGNVDFGKGEEGYQVTFSHTFTEEASEEETYYFAFSYPYSLEESLKASQRMLKKYQDSKTIYFHKEILTLSLENRPMELLTITGKDDKIMTEREKLIEGLFPYHDGENEMRPFLTNKPTVFLTARVHPGETPASYVLNGILNFILNEKSELAKILRDRFVFKVIPILNPDGVYRGYYRHDTKN